MFTFKSSQYLRSPLVALALTTLAPLALTACGGGGGSGDSTTRVLTGCEATTVQWQDASQSLTCSANLGTGIPDEVRSVLDNTLSDTDRVTGSANYVCSGSQWTVQNADSVVCEEKAGGIEQMTLSLQAADGSRFYEYVSDAYSEIGRAWNGDASLDGFFSPIAAGDSAIALGSGITQHPSQGDWSNFAQVEFDARNYTGTGTYEAPITSIAGDLNQYVLGEQTVNNAPYSSTYPPAGISNGFVKLEDNQVVGIYVTAAIEITMQNPSFGEMKYDGTLTVNDGGTFSLLIGDINTAESAVDEFTNGEYSRLWHWDYTGTVVLPTP